DLLLEERLEVLLAHRLHVRVLGADPALLVEAHQVLIHQLHALLARGGDHRRDLERLPLADEVRHRIVVEHDLDGQDAPLSVARLEQILADHRAQAVGERGADLLLLPGGKALISRSTVVAALTVWTVPNTRCPVSAAITVNSMV